MLTVDYDRLDLRPGMTVLDLGCGEGRHAFEAYRRGAKVVAVDWGVPEVETTKRWLGAIDEAGEAPDGARYEVVRGDLLRLPFPDASVDRVMASEVLEHIPDDVTAMAEIFRVLKPGGRVAVTVPRYGPERICWALSDEYHANEGGHIRIYRADVLRTRLASVGLTPGAGHHAHALHAPFWWLNRTAERVLDPLFGKSLIVYADKPGTVAGLAGAGAGGAAHAEREQTAAAR